MQIAIAAFRQAKAGETFACIVDADIPTEQRQKDLTVIEGNQRALREIHRLRSSNSPDLKHVVQILLLDQEMKRYSKESQAKCHYMFNDVFANYCYQTRYIYDDC